MHKEGRRGVMHVADAFVYSMQGLRAAWVHETAFRLQCARRVPLVPLALPISRGAL